MKDTDTTVTYIVSSLPRSGTSCAMGALHLGMPEVPGDWREEALETASKHVGPEGKSYQLNPKGFYESSISRREPGWHYKIQGMLAKVMNRNLGSLGHITGNRYQIMYLFRKYPAWCKSWKRSYGTQPMGESEFHHAHKTKLGILYQRRDCTVVEVDFEELIEQPEAVVLRLNNWGFNITNPDGFCSHVDESLRRNG